MPRHFRRIHADLVHELYVLKQRTGLPMTVLLNLAIVRLLDHYRHHEGDNQTDHT